MTRATKVRALRRGAAQKEQQEQRVKVIDAAGNVPVRFATFRCIVDFLNMTNDLGRELANRVIQEAATLVAQQEESARSGKAS